MASGPTNPEAHRETRREAGADRGTSGRVGHPVEAASRLRTRVADEVTGIAGGTPLAGRLHVGWYAAREAAACPARYRARGEEGWDFPGWSAPLAAAAIGRAALAHHLDTHDRSSLGGRTEAPLPAPLEAVRAWMRAMAAAADCPVGDWVADRFTRRDGAALAAAASGGARWMAGFVRVLGWPLPGRLRLLGAARDASDRPLRWSPGQAPVAVSSGADARLGRVAASGDFALVVHRVTAGDDGGLHDRTAFEAVAGALAIGIVPAAVVVTAGDTGERLRVPVAPHMLDRGADLVAGVVRERVAATGGGFDPSDARPSAACHHCPVGADCAPGRAWIADPGRGRGGLPAL